MNRIHFGDCRDGLRAMAAAGKKVQMCVTSPPYFGLRDYGHNGQIGLEETPEQYIANLVEVFRAVRDVLADDGTLWLNCGDSYSTGVANLTDLVKREFERGVLFFGSADPRGRSSEGINVLLYDKRAPNRIFKPLFTAQRISIKQGQYDLCEIGGAFDAPVECFSSCAFGLTNPNDSGAEYRMDLPEHVAVIVTAGDLRADAALCNAIALTVKDGKASFPIEIATEPVAEGIASGIPAYDTVTFDAASKCCPQVNAVNDAVSLLDGPNLVAGYRRNFTVREAGDQKLALTLHGSADICFAGVGHLFLLGVGLSPYCSILDKAQRQWNAQRPKQELGVPEMLKRALMEDGWICRQTIIWHKPNPMPESVTDRCTKAHEYLFLLSKSPRYYYDAEAVKEPAVSTSPAGNKTHKYVDAYAAGAEAHRTKSGLIALSGVEWQTRNRRSVWTIPTKPYAGAHFAVMAPALVEPCILAGTSERGHCQECGARWIRQVERSTSFEGGSGRAGTTAEQANASGKHVGGIQGGNKNLKLGPVVKSATAGWTPSCACGGDPVPDTVLDPFMGSGTTAAVSILLGRDYAGCELNPDYKPLQDQRIAEASAERAEALAEAERRAAQLDLFAEAAA